MTNRDRENIYDSYNYDSYTNVTRGEFRELQQTVEERAAQLAKGLDDIQRQINPLKITPPVVDHAAHIRAIIMQDDTLTVHGKLTLYIQTCRDLKLL